MYSISNQQRDLLLRAVELLRKAPVEWGLRDGNIVRMAVVAARKLEKKKPMEEER